MNEMEKTYKKIDENTVEITYIYREIKSKEELEKRKTEAIKAKAQLQIRIEQYQEEIDGIIIQLAL